MRPPSQCPKCQLEARSGAVGCPRCGLLLSRWEGFAVDTPTHPALDQPWDELMAAWEDDDAHARFVEAAAAADALDVAAARYRQRRQTAPEDGRAQRGLEKVAILAQRLYEMRAREERPPRAPLVLRVAGTLFAMLVLGASCYVLIVAVRNHQ